MGACSVCLSETPHAPPGECAGLAWGANQQPPGVLPRQHLWQLIRSGAIQSLPSSPISPSQVQPCSLDLRLSRRVWILRAGFLPRRGQSLEATLDDLAIARFDMPDHGCILERGRLAVIELYESVQLPPHLRGDFNPKSSTGRVDLLTRVLADDEERFDVVSTPGGLKHLFIEITPLSFHVHVCDGLTLTQMRVVDASTKWIPSADLQRESSQHPLLYVLSEGDRDPPMPVSPLPCRSGDDGAVELTVDLTGPLLGWRAVPHSGKPDLDLRQGRGSLVDLVEAFWHPIRHLGRDELILEPGEFYLLSTRELLTMPPHLCASLDAYDVTSSEGRVHYAGFVDSGFGFGSVGPAPLTMEVRVHHSPFRVSHGQPIALLRYLRMREQPDGVLYGGEAGSNYARQRGPTLAKQFLGGRE